MRDLSKRFPTATGVITGGCCTMGFFMLVDGYWGAGPLLILIGLYVSWLFWSKPR